MRNQKYLTENLPVYKESYELLKYCIILISNLPKNIRVVYGNDIKYNLYQLMDNIYYANSIKIQRVEYIDKALTNIRFINLMLRIGFDMRHITIKQKSRSILLVENISRQLSGWKNSS